MSRSLRAVCVYCGSAPGAVPRYADVATAVGRLLAAEGVTVVYGGGAVGLLGAVADAALAAGGQVVGVIPRGLFRREVGHQGITELVEVHSMHERKHVMMERSDAFVALPGGLGTLEELVEVASWAQLGIHAKPVVTVDVDGFWQPLHALLRHASEAGFLPGASLDLIGNVERVDDLLPALREWQVPAAVASLALDES